MGCKPGKKSFYKTCHWFKWFLQWFLLPSSIQAVHQQATLILSTHMEECITPLLTPNPSLRLTEVALQVVKLSIPLFHLSFSQPGLHKRLLLQGYSGFLWTENNYRLKNWDRKTGVHSSSEHINHCELSQATPRGLGFPCQRWVTNKLPTAHREQKIWLATARGWVLSKN